MRFVKFNFVHTFELKLNIRIGNYWTTEGKQLYSATTNETLYFPPLIILTPCRISFSKLRHTKFPIPLAPLRPSPLSPPPPNLGSEQGSFRNDGQTLLQRSLPACPTDRRLRRKKQSDNCRDLVNTALRRSGTYLNRICLAKCAVLFSETRGHRRIGGNKKNLRQAGKWRQALLL